MRRIENARWRAAAEDERWQPDPDDFWTWDGYDWE